MDPISIAMGLAQFVPQIVKWVSGSDKAAEAAGKVVDIAKAVTGKSDADQALAAIQADPALVAQFRLSVLAQEASLDRAFLADRQDARHRDVAIRQLGHHNYRADVMLAMAFICLITILYMSWHARLDMPDMVFAFLNMTAGALLKMIGDAFQFEFGSSRGSKEKDSALGDALRK
jgi:hypothetical protein